MLLLLEESVVCLEWYTDFLCSASPLNGQAAELWDKDMAEYKRLVLARHKTPEELDA